MPTHAFSCNIMHIPGYKGSRSDFEWGALLEGHPRSAPCTSDDKLRYLEVFFLVDGCEGVRQGCIQLGPPALRPLSELLDIVVQLLIGCCLGIGQPSVPVAAGSPHIRIHPLGQGSGTLAQRTLPLPGDSS